MLRHHLVRAAPFGEERNFALMPALHRSLFELLVWLARHRVIVEPRAARYLEGQNEVDGDEVSLPHAETKFLERPVQVAIPFRVLRSNLNDVRIHFKTKEEPAFEVRVARNFAAPLDAGEVAGNTDLARLSLLPPFELSCVRVAPWVGLGQCWRPFKEWPAGEVSEIEAGFIRWALERLHPREIPRLTDILCICWCVGNRTPPPYFLSNLLSHFLAFANRFLNCRWVRDAYRSKIAYVCPG